MAQWFFDFSDIVCTVHISGAPKESRNSRAEKVIYSSYSFDTMCTPLHPSIGLVLAVVKFIECLMFFVFLQMR